MGPTINVRNLSLSLNGRTILAPITTGLAAGQLHLLVGPNGAGKTSLLRSLLGLTAYRGEIIREWPGAAQRPVYIPQQPRFDQVLPVTCADFLLAAVSRRPVFLRASRQRREQVAALLDRVGMKDKAGLQLGQLSGGERQRLMFALALSRPADLWFLDEPMTGLDTQGQALFSELILSLRAEKKTLIMVHHDMQFVADHADNVLQVDGGLKQSGHPQSLQLETSSRKLSLAEVA